MHDTQFILNNAHYFQIIRTLQNNNSTGTACGKSNDMPSRVSGLFSLIVSSEYMCPPVSHLPINVL